ncbi:hypothetical protein ABZ635_20310 [Nocardiopsis sp. NPDC007018]|uniref:hypothetical protein n=1 Tax=Nocardiopsis sp. NPDC007018 TaxID=3155721 RepID=UPI0033D06EB0
MPLPLPSDPSSSTLYLDWVRSHSPEHEPQARRLLDRFTEQLRTSPHDTGYLQGYMDSWLRETGLPTEHRPWLADTVAHRLLRHRGGHADGQAARHAAAAYLRARELESRHGLTRDPHHVAENALLFARHGVLPASEVRAHRDRLAEHRTPEEAHREFVRFLDAWASGGAVAAAAVRSPHNRASVGTPPPADLVSQVRVSVRSLDLAPETAAEETSRVIGRFLADSRGNPVPDGLLNQAGAAFTKAPPRPEHTAGIAALFPTTAGDGAAWLRMLETSGIADAMVEGRLRPEGGYAAWLSEFHFMYGHLWSRNTVGQQELPEELFTMLSRLAPRLRAEAAPVRLFEGRYLHNRVNGRLLIACDDLGIAVDAPEDRTRPIREAVRLARSPQLDPDLVEETRGRLARLRSVPLGEVELELSALDLNLSHPVMAALEGLPASLAELDMVEPLARTLRFGVPAEHTWPAFEEAVAEVAARPGGVLGATSTWPALTVYGRDTAITVDHAGRRGTHRFHLPEEAAAHVVHHVGGDALVTWWKAEDHQRWGDRRPRAFWCSAPEDTFSTGPDPALYNSGTAHHYDLGLVLESPDGGRYDKDRILYPGDRTGITYEGEHTTDGVRVWNDPNHWDTPAPEVDAATGAPAGSSGPDFLTEEERLDYAALLSTRLHLVRLPDGVDDSPLGAKDGLAGARAVWTGPGEADDRHPDRAIEGTDGRRAAFSDHRDLIYWGVVRMPENPAEGLLAYRWQSGHTVLQCRDATDDSLVWEVWSYPKGRLRELDAVGRRPLVPPPAYWHFLAPRDPATSRALRAVDSEAARLLLESALAAPVPEDPAPDVALPEVADGIARARAAAVREALPRVLAEVTDPEVVEGVVWAVLWAVELRLTAEAMADRTGRVRSGRLPRPAGEVPDRKLADALAGLLPDDTFTLGFPDRSGLITAIAADGARLEGRSGEPDRRLGPPGTPAAPWTRLLGLTDALVWRLATGSAGDDRRDALVALVRTLADQPFTKPGTEWVTGTATGAALGPLLATGRAVVTDPPRDRQRYANAAAPHWSGRYLPERRYGYLRPATAPAPEGAEEAQPLRVERDEAGRLRGFLESWERRGPVEVPAEAVKVFRQHTGVMRPVAEFVLTGGAGWPGALPSSKTAQTEYRRTGATLSAADTNRLLGSAVPADPADLWEDGGMVRAAERMARVWVELLGVRPSASARKAKKDDLPALVKKDLGLGPEWAALLTGPGGASERETSGGAAETAADASAGGGEPEPRADTGAGEVAIPLPNGPWERPLMLDRSDGVYPVSPATDSQVYLFSPENQVRPYLYTASLLVWALTELPVGHPGRARADLVHDEMVRRLRSPQVVVPAPAYVSAGKDEKWIDLTGAREVRVSVEGTRIRVGAGGTIEPGTGHALWSDGVLVVPEHRAYRFSHVMLLLAGFFDDEAVDRCLRGLDEGGWHELAFLVRQTRVVCGGGLTRMVERAANTPVPAGGFEADPRLSAPELVAEVSERLRVNDDAATLYLQVLALAHPTDGRVRRWNGWGTDRHRKAEEHLLARGVVERRRRSRAGRTLFLPGGWTELKAPFPPMETAKLESHFIGTDSRRAGHGPFSRALPVAPPHEMFAEAWRERGVG